MVMPRYQALIMVLAYVVLLLGVYVFEAYRTRNGRPDSLSMFLVVCLVQCALPAVLIYGLLPYTPDSAPTGNPVFDRILQTTDFSVAFGVWTLTVWFIVFFYIGCALGGLMFPDTAPTDADRPYVLTVRPVAIAVLVGLGLALTFYSFMSMGDSMLSRYTNLILFRAGYEGIERNAINANALVLTQAWSWLAVVALFAIREQRGRGLIWVMCLLASVVFVIAGVSRRALFLPVLLAYLTLALRNGRWYRRWVLAALVPLLLLIAFGKDLMATFAWGGRLDAVAGTYETAASAVLRGASEVGITIVESLGTLQFMDLPMRFGIDHVLSIARRIPEGMVGLEFQFPERIVRLSTEAMAGNLAQDVPPGLLGQMWLDLRVLGPVAWGLLFGLQISVVQYFFGRTRLSFQSAAVFVVLIFVVALPINTGSFDFTFSVDIAALLVALLICVKPVRTAAVPATSHAQTVLN